ncbi:MAG: hypothetical protein BJ554DRAFT_8287 [Olpidium bornovanus]|uniref:Uncharacterized protein n=1 Tax=Olpidium bornovanus TaxID=278681 RepID=A0A8H8DJ67_9FUNG|nr:MAG: hypothetical protein BJ554DRAFT_8287 [Olpidium bornovanus]
MPLNCATQHTILKNRTFFSEHRSDRVLKESDRDDRYKCVSSTGQPAPQVILPEWGTGVRVRARQGFQPSLVAGNLLSVAGPSGGSGNNIAISPADVAGAFRPHPS